MTAKKKTTGSRAGRKLRLKKDTIRDLDARGESKELKGGNTGFATCLCTAGATNCKLSCVAVCGGGSVNLCVKY